MQQGREPRTPPRLAARFWDEFSGKQTVLSNFFQKRTAGEDQARAVVTSSQSTGGNDAAEAASLPPSENITTSDTSSASTSQAPVPASQTPPAPDSPPTLSELSVSALVSRQLVPKKGVAIKSKSKKPGQTKLSSFFAKPPAAVASTPAQRRPRSAFSPRLDGPSSSEAVASSDPATQIDADREFACMLAEAEGEVAPTRTASSASQSQAVWSTLLAPLEPPKCKVHGEPAKQLTVTKPGPNKGKTFFLCSRCVDCSLFWSVAVSV